LQAALAAGSITREDIFVTTKLWNNNHRPERVGPALEASCARLGLDYLNLYLVHTPFAFQPGDEQDPRDQNGEVIYDTGVTLLDTWRAMEDLVDRGRCRAIGLSDILLDELRSLYESARIKPAVVQVETHPYLPETELLDSASRTGLCFLRLRRWVTASGRGRLETSSSPGLPGKPARRPHKCCLPGRYSVAGLA
jgi:alcohol dehydrogenase (NADP+)